MVTTKPSRITSSAIAPEKDDAAAAFISGSAALTPPASPVRASTVVIPSAPMTPLAPIPPMTISGPAAAAVEDHRLTLRMPQDMKVELDRLRTTKFRGMTLTGVILLALNSFIDQNKSK